MSKSQIFVGVVGYSDKKFDKEKATKIIEDAFASIDHICKGTRTVILNLRKSLII